MKILATGTTGSIGSSLVPYFEKKGHEVIRLRSDIRDEHSVEEEIANFRNAELVLHMAAVVTSVPAELAGRNTLDVNVTGSFNVATAALRNNLRFCYFSTTVKYSTGLSVIREDSKTDSPTLYGNSKHLGELAVKHVYRNASDELLVVRPCFTYGSSKDYSVVTNLIRSHFTKEPVVVRLNKLFKKDYTHIDDFSEAIDLLISQYAFGDYNITAGDPMSFGTILEMLESKSIKPFMYLNQENDYLGDHIVSPEKLVKTTGWQPKISLSKGMDMIINKFKNE